MFDIHQNQSQKTGLPPGSLIHVGEKKTEKISIRITDYNESQYEEKETEHVEACFPFRDRETITWIHVCGLHVPQIIEAIGQYYNIHHLILEDVLNTAQRPKLEDYEDMLFMVLKMFSRSEAGVSEQVRSQAGAWERDENSDREQDENVSVDQFSLILGENFVISFQESETDIFEPVRKRARNDKGRIRKMGADYLAYTLTDTIVDHYFAVTEILDDRIEIIEEELFTDFSQDILQEIHQLKRDIIFLHKAVLPVRSLIAGLQKSDSFLVRDDTQIYLRDLYDHVIQIADKVETFREITNGLLDIYHSGVSNKMNEVMKVLTIIATVFIPLTFIAGIYGMNFKFMPELEWKWGYPAIWLIILVIGILMMVYFKKKKWL